MTAKVNGRVWHADAAIAASSNGGIVGVAGTSSDGVTVAFGTFATGGTLRIEDGGGTNGVYGNASAPGASWSASPSLGTGYVTIDEVTSTGTKGSFAFEANPLPTTTATGTKSITEGHFDVTFGVVAGSALKVPSVQLPASSQ